jgi:hypothetical protein
MNSNLLHEPRTAIERRTQRQLWIVTLLAAVVILFVAIYFFATR